jgi:hypothetical protein
MEEEKAPEYNEDEFVKDAEKATHEIGKRLYEIVLLQSPDEIIPGEKFLAVFSGAAFAIGLLAKRYICSDKEAEQALLNQIMDKVKKGLKSGFKKK